MKEKLKDWYLRLRKAADNRPVGICGNCKKEKRGVEKRKYLVPAVSPVPITSVNELCDDCFDKINKIITDINDETKSEKQK